MSDDSVTLKTSIAPFLTSYEKIGKKYVLVNAADLSRLHIKSGKMIELHAKDRFTVALTISSDDIATGVIGVDSILLRILQCKEGDDIQMTVTTKRGTPVSRITLVVNANATKWTEEEAMTIKNTLLSRYQHVPLIKNDIIISVPRNFDGMSVDQQFTFTVHSVPNDVLLIASSTEIVFDDAIDNIKLSIDDVGGMHSAKKKLEELVLMPLLHPEIFAPFKESVRPPRGIILHGPPGSGKTLLIKAIANSSNAHFIYRTAGDIFNKYYGESESKIRNMFKDARQYSPSIIFIDEFDAVASKRRDDMGGEVERRVVTEFLVEMDGMRDNDHIIVIASTNRINDIDMAFRRPGRFDYEIPIEPPNTRDRLEILLVHTRHLPMKDVDLTSIARRTSGYVGADLEGVVREATIEAIRRAKIKYNFDIRSAKQIDAKIIRQIVIVQSDFESAINAIKPSVLREATIDVSNVDIKDIAGLDASKKAIEEAILWNVHPPVTNPYMAQRLPRNILLYGPPGCGKTFLGKAIANQPEINFLYVKSPEMYSKWVGETEKAIRNLFTKARQAQPCVIFIDEIDSLAPIRSESASSTELIDRTINQLLLELGGIEDRKKIIVIGATNRPDRIEPSLLRKGRFDYEIYVPPPNQEARKKIFEVQLRDLPHDIIDYNILSEQTHNYSGSDIEAIVTFANIGAIRNHQDRISMKNLFDAIKVHVSPSITKESLAVYEKFESRQDDQNIVRLTTKNMNDMYT